MTDRIQWTLEDDVNDYVKKQLDRMGKIKNRDYTVESSMSQYMREALAGFTNRTCARSTPISTQHDAQQKRNGA